MNLGPDPAAVADLIDGCSDRWPVAVSLSGSYLEAMPQALVLSQAMAEVLDASLDHAPAENSQPALGPAGRNQVPKIQAPTNVLALKRVCLRQGSPRKRVACLRQRTTPRACASANNSAQALDSTSSACRSSILACASPRSIDVLRRSVPFKGCFAGLGWVGSCSALRVSQARPKRPGSPGTVSQPGVRTHSSIGES